ncbi:hypothetical protein [Spirillospora sp. NPDC047279]|uniref:hypothetical protein n=1 Tax=Spirillospora sp. NPDC047279 TaxID=3155478 RepID=UPI0033CA8E49
MTAKTSKDADAVGADETEPDETTEARAEETAPKPAAKRKRRVRVIEVLDDEDLDEVLESLDEEEEDEPAPRKRPAAKKKPVIVEPEIEDEDEEEDEEPAPKAKAKPKPKPKAPAPDPAGPTVLGLPRTAAIVVVVLVALLASLAIWQWRTASSATGKEDARAEITEQATAFGNLATSYNASNYQSQMEKIQKLMTGDLLERYKSQTAPGLAGAFKTSPNASLASKTKQVFVGGVDGKFATAVVSVDITVSDGKQTSSVPQSLIRLAFVNEGGQWKVSQMNASGDDGSGSSGQLPNVPSTQPSPTQKPKN